MIIDQHTDRSTEQENLEYAIREYVCRSLVGFGGIDGFTASGTLVRVGDDLLIATAGHVVQELRRKWSQVLLVVTGIKRDQDRDEYPSEVRKTFEPTNVENSSYEKPLLYVAIEQKRIMIPGIGIGMQETEARAYQGRNTRVFENALEYCKYTVLPKPDVGFVKVKEDRFQEFCDLAVDLENLAPRIEMVDLAKQHQQVAGFPLAASQAVAVDRPLRFISLTTSVNYECKHEHPDSAAMGLEIDYGIHVDWSGYVDPKGIAHEMCNAKGMSGAPLWTVLPSDKKTIWHAQKWARFVGTLFFYDHPNCVRAEPVSNWIDLVASAGINAWTKALSDAHCI